MLSCLVDVYVVIMSTSLLKKSLRLFEADGKSNETTHKRQIKGREVQKTHSTTSVLKTQKGLKDRKVKSALETFVKKHKKQDRTAENLAILDKLSQKEAVTQQSAEKVSHAWLFKIFERFKQKFFLILQIFSYQLKKHNKDRKQKIAKKTTQKTVFTDEDFEKFEKEYFVKSKF